ncbi:GtrA family protein [Hyphomonas oceanitis]|uniref:GtrA family protein n=1 Tax=Hyphomonas oceanitis SCH89 TaxID=1280953 RepID=A0A059G2A1_9PROT|nr:GtrA family protein [Hyphomonas oceanitis]KDA00700.1 GtrA family protein [Hyphomonas oceanitis SCH89]
MNRLPRLLRSELSLRAVRFFFVGLVGTGAYALIGYSLILSGMAVIIAHIIASVISLMVSYMAQKIVTFRVRGQHQRMGPRYAISTAVLIAAQFILVCILKFFCFENEIILAVNILFVPPASFLIHNFWTFNRPGGEDTVANEV